MSLSQSKPQLKLDWCSHAAAKYAVEHWHYSRTMPKSKLAKIGVWEDGRFIGAVLFGVGATSQLVMRYGLDMTQGCELVRVALTAHRTHVSRIVAIALKLIRRTYPGLRLVVSFADPEHGHAGGIYQAGGWIYAGTSAASDEYMYRGKRWQGRSFRNKYKGMKHHPAVKVVKGSAKHRYLMPLDDAMRAQITPLAKPYPKPRATSIDSDALLDQGRDGGANPTVALHSTDSEFEHASTAEA